MNDGGSAVVTPVKVYVTNQNSFCRIRNFDFTSAGKDVSHNLLNPREKASSEKLHASIRSKLERLLGQALE